MEDFYAQPIRIHLLKTWPEYYREIVKGEKRFELRRDDRGFKVGDVLRLQEWSNYTGEYSGSFIDVQVTYILGGGMNKVDGIQQGYCIMSFAILPVNFHTKPQLQ